ncbi:MAG TPA: hypothetical protein DCZ10_11220 [Pelotomaculum sp.]|nr:hypothetical protein [Pelotomaculum sp.]
MKIFKLKTVLILTVLTVFIFSGLAYAATSAYYYRQADNTLSASGTDGSLKSTIIIQPSQTNYDVPIWGSVWGWPKNTILTQDDFVKNLDTKAMPLASRLGYDPNQQSFYSWNAYSGYLTPTNVNFKQVSSNEWRIDVYWDAAQPNEIGAIRFKTQNTLSDYNYWGWVSYQSGKVQALSGFGDPTNKGINIYGPIIEFQPFWYWTTY